MALGCGIGDVALGCGNRDVALGCSIGMWHWGCGIGDVAFVTRNICLTGDRVKCFREVYKQHVKVFLHVMAGVRHPLAAGGAPENPPSTCAV